MHVCVYVCACVWVCVMHTCLVNIGTVITVSLYQALDTNSKVIDSYISKTFIIV